MGISPYNAEIFLDEFEIIRNVLVCSFFSSFKWELTLPMLWAYRHYIFLKLFQWDTSVHVVN